MGASSERRFPVQSAALTLATSSRMDQNPPDSGIASTLQVWNSKQQQRLRARRPSRRLPSSPTRPPSEGVVASMGSAKGHQSQTRRPASTRASLCPETGPKTIPPPASQRESDSRLVTSESTSKGGADVTGLESDHASFINYLPVQPTTTKCNLCHKSRHGVIFFKIEIEKVNVILVVIVNICR